MIDPVAQGEDAAQMVVQAWLSEMERCVRDLDYSGCRRIFAEDVVGFGTRASMVIGLDALERDQWRNVWSKIRGFTFTVEDLQVGTPSDELLWLACPWTSERRGADAEWHSRHGRITAILERRNGQWLAVHTHHSIAPSSGDLPSGKS
jgi:ketosteroid isomerase-like protein